MVGIYECPQIHGCKIVGKIERLRYEATECIVWSYHQGGCFGYSDDHREFGAPQKVGTEKWKST